MKKIVLIALCAFLSVVAIAQNFDNGCVYSPTKTTVEVVQFDAYQADVLSIEMNVQYNGMPEFCFYTQTADVVYFDFQTLAITFADTGQTISYALPQSLFTNYLQRNTASQRHRLSGIMIRQVQAA